MKKKYFIMFFATLSLGIILITNCNQKMSNSDKVRNIEKLAILVDGERKNEFPSKSSYKVDVKCEGANASWDYNNWKLIIDDVTEEVLCSVSFSTTDIKTLNNHIIGLSGTEQGTGKVISENGYRYEGKNPNNYVVFNNEIWRIVGVFDDKTHGQTGKNLTKIIRENPIGKARYGTLNINNWKTSDIRELLNNYYYNSMDASDTEYCYSYYSTDIKVKGNCDYRQTGLNDESKNMIVNAKWFLGAFSSSSTGENTYLSTADDYFKYERSNVACNNCSYTDDAFVGLVYPSDFAYAVLSENCPRTTLVSKYKDYLYGNDNLSCNKSMWLNGSGTEWMITPLAGNSTTAFAITLTSNFFGGIYTSSANSLNYIRPTVYLNENVKIYDGEGSGENPYIIGM